MARLPRSRMLAAGLLLAGSGLILMSGVEQGDEWTALLGGFLIARCGHRAAQPADRGRRRERGAARAERHGVGDQRHVPPGGDRRRHRGLRRAFLGEAESEIASAAPGADAHGLAEAVSSGNLPADTPAQVVDAAREGFLAGFNQITLIGAALAITGAIVSLGLVRSRDIRDAPEFGEPEPMPVGAAA